MLLWPKSGAVLFFSVRHAPRTPSDWLGGPVLGPLLLSYTRIIHTYISDHMHHTEIVAANQLIIVQHPTATDIGWSTLSITTKISA